MRFALLSLFMLHAAATSQAVDGIAFFETKVRPVLTEHCYGCHGPEKQKGGLRWDSRDGWARGGDSGPALVAGDAAKSLLAKAISHADRDLKMPPKQALPASVQADLVAWIAMGAPDPRTDAEAAKAKPGSPADAARTHWSFQPITDPKVPAVKDASWPRQPLDRFVLARLEKEGLTPASDAPAHVLARRLAFDLTGMPPRSETTDVSAMLDSRAFAEQWGQHWLDMVRFAESSGGGRTLPFKDAWRYRDYVLESIHNDVPLDRFITEQVAGDLLPHRDAAERRRNLTATGLLVLGPTNYEEQDKRLLRMDIVDEQLDTMGRSFLGMSIGCARCHDHKFDPIPARDYYAMAGILRSTKIIRDPKENVAHWIEAPLPMDGEIEQQLVAKEQKIEQLTAQLDTAKKQLKRLTPRREPKDASSRPLAIEEAPGIVVDESLAKRVGEWKLSTRYPTYIGDGYLHDDHQPKGELTLTYMPTITQAGRYEVRFAYTSTVGRATNVPVHILHADGEEDLTVDQSTLPPIAGRFVSLGQYRFEAGGQGYVMISNAGADGVVTADAVVFIPVADVAAIDAKDDATESKDEAVVKAEAAVKKIDTALKKLTKAAPHRATAMSVAEHEDLGDTAIHIRGNYRNLGTTVPRGFLQAAYHGPAITVDPKTSGRLQLAQWITSPQNTLTARVLANRVWMHLMGEGLVRSVDNFGTTGDAPTHPELLDHLAQKLIAEHWSLKALVRYIVESRTYRMASNQIANHQSSIINRKSKDPSNQLLSHQNRKRLSACQLRDAMLVMSGAMDERWLGPTIGGETTVEDACDSKVLNVEYNYEFTDKRRSVYAPAFRNKRLELFEVFDFGNNNLPIAKRATSSVAPQALYLLNHSFVNEQSLAMAKRLISAVPASDEERVQRLYQEALGRAPTAQEQRLSLDFVQVSTGAPDSTDTREATWARLVQAVMATPDFRWLE